MKDLILEIASYVDRNAIIKPAPFLNQMTTEIPEESDGTKFMKNIDSAYAVSQVFSDIMSPLNIHSRTPSLDIMIDVIYLLYDLSIATIRSMQILP